MTRRLAIWLALIVVFIALVISAAAAGSGTAVASISEPLEQDGVSYSGTVVQDGDSDRSIAVIPITGTIVNGDSAPDGSATGGDDIVRMLDAIEQDADRFDGVVLKVDSPGGSVLASEEIAEAVKHLKQETKLPVLSWMRDAAASGGYYVSAPTDRIVAAPSTFTGSIGVILEYYEVKELADEIGVAAVTIKSGKLKDIGSPFKKISEEERAVLQAIIDEAYGDFVDVVADGRDLPEDEVRELADGRIYTGRQAKELDLVDALGTRRVAYDEMADLLDADDVDGEDLDIIEFSRSYTFFEALSAGTQPTLDMLAAAKAAGGVLRGEGFDAATIQRVTGARNTGNGLARVEYRAVLG